jgi:hypothetical protein
VINHVVGCTFLFILVHVGSEFQQTQVAVVIYFLCDRISLHIVLPKEFNGFNFRECRVFLNSKRSCATMAVRKNPITLTLSHRCPRGPRLGEGTRKYQAENLRGGVNLHMQTGQNYGIFGREFKKIPKNIVLFSRGVRNSAHFGLIWRGEEDQFPNVLCGTTYALSFVINILSEVGRLEERFVRDEEDSRKCQSFLSTS